MPGHLAHVLKGWIFSLASLVLLEHLGSSPMSGCKQDQLVSMMTSNKRATIPNLELLDLKWLIINRDFLRRKKSLGNLPIFFQKFMTKRCDFILRPIPSFSGISCYQCYWLHSLGMSVICMQLINKVYWAFSCEINYTKIKKRKEIAICLFPI